MGLERLASVSQQVLSNYDTDLFVPIHAALRKITGHATKEFEAQRFSYQVIADHSRAVTFLLADGIRPEMRAWLRASPHHSSCRTPRATPWR